MQNYILKNTIKFALFIFGLSFSKLVLGTAIGNSPIDFSGSVGASISGDSVTITIESISNSSSTYTSGSLRIELWATSTLYSGGSITGTRTASIRTSQLTGLTDQIQPNHTFSNITINTSYTTPSSSNTNFTLILTEYSESCSASDGFCIIAYAPLSGDSDSSDYTISGTILDENGAAVSGATIMLTGAGQTFSTSTNSAGSFSLTFPREDIPDTVAYVVVRDGFIPVAQGFSLNSSGSSNIGSVSLEELGPETVLIEVVPELHHLGDNNFGGSVNSQFQQSSEGTTFSRNFSVTSTQLTGTSATVTLLAKGLQESNQLSINGYSIGTLDSSPSDGSFASVGFSGIPIGIFNAGVNTLTIRSDQNDFGFGDYDDFEFTNVVIQFENISSSSTNPDSPAHSGTYQSIYGINIMPLGDGVLSGNSDSASENGSLQTSDFDLGGGVYLDVYEFTLHDANTVDFSLSTSGYSSVVYLVRIDGNQGVISLETLFQTSNANSALRQLSAGTYWIGVSGLTPFSLGSYDLNVLSAIATSSSGGSFDSVYGFPVEFLTGNVVNGTLNESDFQLEDQSYFDVFQFTVNQTTDYRIELSSDDIDTYLYVARILDNQIIDNEVFFFDDDSGAGTNSIVNGSLPPGTYWIVATSYGPNDTGSYSLTLIRDL